jgi:hypothetical protein
MLGIPVFRLAKSDDLAPLGFKMSEELLLDFLTQNPKFIVYVIGLIDFAKRLSRRVRGARWFAHT